MTEWKNIHNDKYSISDQGDVKNNQTGKILKHSPSKRGYSRVSLSNGINSNPTILFPHRKVAELFIPNPDNKPEVNHKNGDKSDPRKDNLEWVTPKENMKHAIETGLFKSKEQSLIANKAFVELVSTKVLVVDPNGDEKTYPSINEAARVLGLWPTKVWRSIKNEKPVNGYLIKAK